MGGAEKLGGVIPASGILGSGATCSIDPSTGAVGWATRMAGSILGKACWGRGDPSFPLEGVQVPRRLCARGPSECALGSLLPLLAPQLSLGATIEVAGLLGACRTCSKGAATVGAWSENSSCWMKSWAVGDCCLIGAKWCTTWRDQAVNNLASICFALSCSDVSAGQKVLRQATHQLLNSVEGIGRVRGYHLNYSVEY